jgi:ATP-binding cassette, subfamily B, bacterial PglK
MRALLRKSQELFGILENRDRKTVTYIAIVQIVLSALDLLGVAAIGLLGAVSVGGSDGRLLDSRIEAIMSLIGLDSKSYLFQIYFLSTSALLLLCSRTLLSIYFTRRILFFFSERGAKISSELVAHLMSQSLLKLQSKPSQEILFSVTRGVEYVVIQILATCVVLLADVSLLLAMMVTLLFVDFRTAICLLFLFSLTFLFLNRFMNERAGVLGQVNSSLNIMSNQKIVEVISSYRETIVRNRQSFYVKEISNTRFKLAATTAEINFLPYVSKYVIELTVVFGALVVAAIQFLSNNFADIVPNLVIFLAAGSRIAPSILRVQQGSIVIRSGLGLAEPTLKLISDYRTVNKIEEASDPLDLLHEGFSPEISVVQASFRYPDRNEDAISKINLRIRDGEIIAVVGSTGSGKSTLIDIILGVLEPIEGTVSISQESPSAAIKKWPGAISYVPQDIVINSGSFLDNICLGYPQDEIDLNHVDSILKSVRLDGFVESLPLGARTQVGERGINLSGGQRQRLGIARALFTKPRLLVLDEATSSLDADTELAISDSIQKLRGSTTVILIAHRLSSVRGADVVVYLENGKILATGTFDEVRSITPDFDRQAKLMGL